MSEYNSTVSSDNPSSNENAEQPEREPPSSRSDKDQAGNRPREYGGRKKGLEPTRYGDWEKDGRCIDF